MLYRYLTKEKFHWLIEDRGLYFGAAADQSDKREGVHDFRAISRMLKARLSSASDTVWKECDAVSEALMEGARRHCYLSSWHSADKESQDMWQQYGSGGVALLAEELSLVDCLPAPLRNTTSFYRVIYDDSRKEAESREPLRLKGGEFQHESEFRAVIDLLAYSITTGYERERFPVIYVGDNPSYKSAGITSHMSARDMAQSHQVIRPKGRGHVVSFDLARFLKAIVLHPHCSDDYASEIKDALQASGLDIAVRRSALEESENS